MLKNIREVISEAAWDPIWKARKRAINAPEQIQGIYNKQKTIKRFARAAKVDLVGIAFSTTAGGSVLVRGIAEAVDGKSTSSTILGGVAGALFAGAWGAASARGANEEATRSITNYVQPTRETLGR